MKYIKGNYAVVPNLDQADLISSTAFKLFVNICRFADNEGKCFPSRSKLAKVMGYKTTRSLDKYIKELVEAGFITKETRLRPNGSHTTNFYQIHLIDDQGSHQIDVGGSHQSGVGGSHLAGVPHNTSINTPIEHIATDVAGNVVNEIIEMFEPVNPMFTSLFSNKTQRSALERLIKRLGEEKTINMVQSLVKFTQMPYCPKISTPLELEKNMGKYVQFVKQELAKKSSPLKDAVKEEELDKYPVVENVFCKNEKGVQERIAIDGIFAGTFEKVDDFSGSVMNRARIKDIEKIKIIIEKFSTDKS